MFEKEADESNKVGLVIALFAIALMFVLYFLNCLFVGLFMIILLIISLIGLIVSVDQIEHDKSIIAIIALILNISVFVLSVLILFSFPIGIGSEKTECILSYSRIKGYINSLM
jgi:small-conductance mechanosensitive channel